MPLFLAHPLRIDARGRTAEATVDEHVRFLVEAVLFTAPGERVGRPEFGSGLRHLVFGASSEQMAAAVEALVHGALQRWLGDVINVESVQATSDEATMTVVVAYSRLSDGERTIASFGPSPGGGAP